MKKRWSMPLLAASATAGYAIGIERRAFTLRHVNVPVLPAGSPRLRILHLSDAHMMPRQYRKQEWIHQLGEYEPDLVVNTGDNLGHVDADQAVLDAYSPLLHFPGAFVFGSNDYYSPAPKNPFTYLARTTGGDESNSRHRDMPYRRLREAFTQAGWLDLNNNSAALSINGLRVGFTGVDDPHLCLNATEPASVDQRADIAIGVAHAPYRQVLDRFHAHGCDVLLAGHTHGGQVCVPGFGALVTNCDLDRGMAKGLHRYPPNSRNPAWLHVSAGLGTSPWQPVRFACRPEATLLTLTG